MALLWFIESVMYIIDDDVWEKWEEELEKRKEAGEMYISLMERKGITAVPNSSKRERAF